MVVHHLKIVMLSMISLWLMNYLDVVRVSYTVTLHTRQHHVGHCLHCTLITGGILWAVFFSFSISLPPVLAVGSPYLKEKICRDVITGKKIMALAVTEPGAGSDVAGLRCSARREGDYYVING
jgi:hypothetical protein